MDQDGQDVPDTGPEVLAFTRGERVAAGFALLVLVLLALPALDVLTNGKVFGREPAAG